MSSSTVLADRRGRVFAANAAADEILGYPGVECLMPLGGVRTLPRTMPLHLGRNFPGSLFLWHVDGRLKRHQCRGRRVMFPVIAKGALVLLQFDGVIFDRRCKALAAKLHERVPQFNEKPWRLPIVPVSDMS